MLLLISIFAMEDVVVVLLLKLVDDSELADDEATNLLDEESADGVEPLEEEPVNKEVACERSSDPVVAATLPDNNDESGDGPPNSVVKVGAVDAEAVPVVPAVTAFQLLWDCEPGCDPDLASTSETA